MEQTLKRLLDAEMRAEETARKAEEEADRLTQEALLEARAREDRFNAQLSELYGGFKEKAEARAAQTVAELRKRYAERHAQMRRQAGEREDEALEAAFKAFTTARD